MKVKAIYVTSCEIAICPTLIASVWNLHKLSRSSENDKLCCKLEDITSCKMIRSIQVHYYCHKFTWVQKRGLINISFGHHTIWQRDQNKTKTSKNIKPIIVFTCHQLSASRTLKVKPNQTNANWWIWTSSA